MWRRLLLVFALAAFAQASYITQTHIHPVASAATASAPSGHGQIPPRDDPSHCPICQEYLLAGAYISPALVALPLPTVVGFPLFFPVVELEFVATVSHSWHGRAPPLT